MLARMWRECKLVQPLWKTVWSFLKVKNRVILRPSNCTTRYLIQWIQTYWFKRASAPQYLQQQCPQYPKYGKTQMSINNWTDKEVVHVHAHTHTHTHWNYSAIKKIEILLFAMMWIKLEGIRVSEISQRKTNITWLHSYVEFIKDQNRWT